MRTLRTWLRNTEHDTQHLRKRHWAGPAGRGPTLSELSARWGCSVAERPGSLAFQALRRLARRVGAHTGEISMGSRFCDDDDVVLVNVDHLGSCTDCCISKQRAVHTPYSETFYLNSISRPQYLYVPSQLDSLIIERLTRLRPRICHPPCSDNEPSPPDREQAAE